MISTTRHLFHFTSRNCGRFMRGRTSLTYARAYSTAATSPVPGISEEPAITTRQFQAETKKLLDIVANSLYSEKEIFCRELISNAADAMEKLRFMTSASSTSTSSSSGSGPSDITISVDPTAKQFIIQDSGVGMTEEELVNYLGTIARSGSKSFVVDAAAEGESESNAKSIIGQFGVGFYSAFMVGDKVTVYTKSAVSRPDGSPAIGYRWESNGLGGSYTIVQDDSVHETGTKIVIHLKDDCLTFANQQFVENVILKYSNFVAFPIKLNGKLVNTIKPIWSMDPQEVTATDHKQFYRFIANAWDEQKYKLHFKVDAPVHMNALLYVPGRNSEVLGMSTMEGGVNLYSRKVLLQSKSTALLPEYFRFLKGVVETDDLPMNVSREMIQNSHFIKKLSDILTGRVIKWLQSESRKDNEKYLAFYSEFGRFIREGVCLSEGKRQQEMAKLLRFETSKSEKPISFDEYLERRAPTNTESKKNKEGENSNDDNIFYLISPTRGWACESPYMEPFTCRNIEVLILSNSDDEFVMERLPDYAGKKLISGDSSEAAKFLQSMDDVTTLNDVNRNSSSRMTPLSDRERNIIMDWFKGTLGGAVSDVTVSESRVSTSYPAVITDHESPTIRRMMKMIPKDSSASQMSMSSANKLEINGEHPVIRNLLTMIDCEQQNKNKDKEEELARDITHQIHDNALIAAGIMDDPRVMLKRLNRLLELSASNK